MSVRSFAHDDLVSVLVVALTVSACGSRKPEADPAKAEALAKVMATAAVPLAGLRPCAAADFQKAQMSQVTLLKLGHEEVPTTFERVGWINPPELDAPFARVLLDGTDEKQRRQAAAEFLAAKQYIVIRVDLLDVPLALEFKELKRGAVGIRAIGYDRTGDPICVKPFTVQNSKEKSEWAMKKSDRAVVDPVVAQALRDDLKVQLFATIEQFRTGP